MGLIDSIIQVESGGDRYAKNPRSSASGPSQFIDSTWLSTVRTARPDLANKSDAELLALKTDPQLSREMTEAYANQNQAILTKAGVPVTDGNTYLAHFAGPGGAVKVLQADPTAPVGDILGPAVVKANPFLANMTAGDLQAWASKKVGGSAAQPQPAPASPAAAPTAPLTVPQQAPIFPAQPQQPGAQPQSVPGGASFQVPADIQAPPIFFAPRRAPDLSKLKMAFKPPVFRG